ncbi:MAG TPA: ornithine cyclodeaminase family protein [Chloroflexia bacterium]|nr:ornithine cyclodeaminase family protein [Chloroflexia bacterium]
MALIIREADVERLVTMREMVAALETAFHEQGLGAATNEPRRRVRTPGGGILHLLGGALPGQGVIGFKAYTSFRPKTRFLVTLYDSNDGHLLALIESDRLGQLRTGAATGVATKYMARTGKPGQPFTLGCFGAGYQARTQVEAVCAVRPVGRLRVYSPTAASREAFAAEMGAALGIQAEAVATPEAVAEDADILVTATTAREPVLRARWLAPGVHLNAAGANMLLRRELDDTIIRWAGRIAVDSIDQAQLEASDLISPREQGLLYWERLVELRQIVAGQVVGRSNDEEITVFKSLGIGLEDVAAGALAYRKALAAGAGETIALLD